MGYKWLFENCDFDEFIWWFSCSCLCDKFGYVKLVINLLVMLKLHDDYMFKWLCWTFGLKWWKVMLLLFIVDEIMNTCLVCCWVMLLMLFMSLFMFEVKLLLCCWVFGENGEMRWIVILMNFHELNELNMMN